MKTRDKVNNCDFCACHSVVPTDLPQREKRNAYVVGLLDNENNCMFCGCLMEDSELLIEKKCKCSVDDTSNDEDEKYKMLIKGLDAMHDLNITIPPKVREYFQLNDPRQLTYHEYRTHLKEIKNNLIEMITSVFSQLEETLQNMDPAKHNQKCSICGHTQIDGSFCGKCGIDLNICKNCGYQKIQSLDQINI